MSTIENVIAAEAAASAAQVVARVMGRDVTRAELTHAFRKVENRSNWKAEITAVLRIETDREMAMISEAVVFFTGSVAKIEAVGRRLYRIRADGYYAAIGA